MEKATKNSLALMEAGLVNNPSICIGRSSTFACVCPECITETQKAMNEMYEKVWSK